MIKIIRHPKNPILNPNPENSWESYAVFNGSIIKKDDRYHLLYRAISNVQNYNGCEFRMSVIGQAVGVDDVNFTDRKIFIKPEQDWEKFGCEDPRVTKIDNQYLIFYTALSNYPPNASSIKVAVALSDDLQTIKEKHLVTPFNAKAMTLFPGKINNKYTAILSVNTDMPPTHMALAQFDNISDIWSEDYWHDWYQNLNKHIISLKRLNSDQIEVGATPIETAYGWLLIYSHIKNYFSNNKIFGIEAILLDRDNPKKIIGRTSEPLLLPREEYELKGTIPNVIFPTGGFIENNYLHIYYGAADTRIAVASCDIDDLLFSMKINSKNLPRAIRDSSNPILIPNPKESWQSRAVFNPAAIVLNNKIHVVYRAMSEDNTSVMGYFNSVDGIHVDELSHEPIYIPRADFEIKKNPGGNSGCEDPRLTKIGDKIYMCYTAFDGVKCPRVALSSINESDFLNKNWKMWSQPVIISPPNIEDKDAFILPDKINGKYVIFHRIDPNIVIDYVDSLDFKNDRLLECKEFIAPRKNSWDSRKIGISSPAIKTEKGWLVIYHGVSEADSEYRVGAMLLDINDPAKIISRTDYPILEPETIYERIGIVNNVVFPCGTVVFQDQLFIYYGGADKVIGVATINYNYLLNFLDRSING